MDDIVETADIVEVVSDHVPLKRSGKDYKGPCPFHTERDPSFYVMPLKRMFYCFGCKATGTVIHFVQKILGLGFHEAAEQVARRYGLRYAGGRDRGPDVSVRERICRANAAATRYFARNLEQDPQADAARSYLADRGITKESIERFGLGYALDEWHGLHEKASKRIPEDELLQAGLLARSESGNVYDRFRGRVMFPITNLQEETVGFGARTITDEEPKYLNSAETPVFSKGKLLYGLAQAREAIRQGEVAIVVEGYTDVIAAHQAGLRHTVATLGTALTEDHIRLLSRLAERIVVAFDADSSGQGAVLRTAAELENANTPVQVAVLPEGEDPDSLIRKGGAEAFDRAVRRATPLMHFAIERIAAAHFDEGAAGRQRAAEEISDLLAALRKPVALSSYMAFAAGTLAAGEMERSAALEEALRQQLTIARRRRRRWADDSEETSRRRQDPRRDREFMAQEVASEALAQVPEGVARAERMLLRGAMADREWAERIFAELPPERFSTRGANEIAAQLRAAWAAEGKLTPAEVHSKLSPGAAEAFGLIAAPSLDDEPSEMPDGALALVCDYWEERRLRELEERVARIPPEEQRSSPDVHEYLELARRRHSGGAGRFSGARRG